MRPSSPANLKSLSVQSHHYCQSLVGTEFTDINSAQSWYIPQFSLHIPGCKAKNALKNLYQDESSCTETRIFLINDHIALPDFSSLEVWIYIQIHLEDLRRFFALPKTEAIRQEFHLNLHLTKDEFFSIKRIMSLF